MSVKVLLILILLIPCILACTSSSNPVDKGNQIMMSFCKQMKKEHDLNIFGSGYGGSPEGKLRLLVLRLTKEKKINIHEARKILIYCCEKLLCDVNSNEEIRSGLLECPFTANNLDIMIGFEVQNTAVDPPYIALAAVLKGNVRYATAEGYKFNEVYEETYEEALRIYQDGSTIDYE